MLFNSWAFLTFLIVVFALFYTPGLSRFQTGVLVLGSLFFYAWESPWLLTLLALSILANSLLSFALLREGLVRHLAVVTAGVILNVCVLAFFKYAAFLYSFLHAGRTDDAVLKFLLLMPLPIGISFYTFEGISLIVDIYRGRAGGPPIQKTAFHRHLLHTSLFVSFFPHLVSGPILEAKDFYPQIGRKFFSDIPWELIFKEVLTGFFLKMVVADNLKDLTFYMESPQFGQQPGKHLVALLIAFSVQIFSDFAGYSLIAVGLARLFGYRIPDNFRFPYLAVSLRDFWTRWHISLSQWLRNYLYIPLGGNRKGPFRTYFNLLLVMLIGGLWHGAAESFLLWGLYHGLGLAVERIFADRIRRPLDGAGFLLPRVVLVFGFVTGGWLLFKLPSLPDVGAYLHAIVANWSKTCRPEFLSQVGIFCAPVAFYHLWHRFGGKLPEVWATHCRAAALAAMLLGVLFNSGSQGRFIYFQF